MPKSPHRTIVYVDGFNFYYGEVRGTPFVKPIRSWMLRTSQLPNPIPGTTIHKPAGW